MKHIRIGITGLSRAGKTVFLTSTLYNLLETTGAHLPLLAKKKVRFSGIEQPLDGSSHRFPYEESLARYRSDKPDWPEPTADMSEFCVSLLPNCGGRPMRPVRLSFVDYPGEKLNDLPLARQSFGTWSNAILKGLGDHPPSDAKLALERAISSEPTRADDLGDCDPADRFASAYRDFCIAAHEHGLILPPVDAWISSGSHESLPFFPLPPAIEKLHPELWQATAKKYDAYVAESVSPFMKKVTGCTYQIVVVDVLAILRSQDPSEYNRAKTTISDILRSFRYFNHGNHRWMAPMRSAAQHMLSTLRIRQPRIQRIAFVCTKADQAAAGTRNNLRALLEQLVDQAATEIRFKSGSLGRISYDFCAAHRCTNDCTVEFQDQRLSALIGRLKDSSNGEEGKIYPGEVPPEWPTTSKWDGFRFPDFAPRALPAINGAPLDHINLDRILSELLIESK